MASLIDSHSPKLKVKKRKRGVLYITLLLMFLMTVILIINAVINEQIRYKREVKQYAELADMQVNITSELHSVGADLLYYAQSELAVATLKTQDKSAQHYLTSLMYKISALQKRYDQIRLLDKQGSEIIRINQDSKYSVKEVAEAGLQKKNQRYYFKNALKLLPGQIYMSPFDLNKENAEIEYPIKPMIRFATPVYSANNELLGVGVINYSGKKLLKIIDDLNQHEGDQAFLINSAGYYLKANEAKKEWAFMFPEQFQFRFSDEQREVWENMLGNEKGLVVTDDGEYYFTSFYLSPQESLDVVNRECVYIVMYVPNRVIHKEQLLLSKGLIVGFFLIAPMLVLLGWGLAKFQVEQAWLFEKLNFEARHDALTGLYNRKAIIDYLNRSAALNRRRNSFLAVGFIDINDLKKMNDQHGHEAGDELIKGLTSVINISIRETDYAARLGGDEFLIVFIDCNQAGAQRILMRIQKIFSSLGTIKTGKKWTMSFGCTEMLRDNDSVDEMIERADSAMYKQKTQYKKTEKGL